MPLIHHRQIDLKRTYISKVLTRTLIDRQVGAESCQVWEQVIPPGGYIVPHTHETEEVLVFLQGEVAVTIEDETTTFRGPASVLVPPNTIHGVQNNQAENVYLLAFFPTVTPTITYPNGQPPPANWE